MCLCKYSAKLEISFWIITIFFYTNEPVLLCDEFKQCYISTTVYLSSRSLMGHVFNCFQTYFWSHQRTTGVFGALLTDCRNSNVDLTIQSHHVVSPRIWNPAPCCSDLLLLSWSYVSSPHPPEPWLRPAFPVNRLLGEEGCPLGWTLPPQGWPGNDPRVPGTRTHWRDTPCPPPQHTANTQCNNVLKMVPSSLLTLT